MATFSDPRPIGIFDSGVGGLTITRAIVDACPQESIVYFGDLAHLPYGDKSQHSIQSYCLRICDFLVAQQCKLIVVGCNTASAVAFDVVKAHVPMVPVLDVIDPVVAFIKQQKAYKKVGLIATKRTVASNAYGQKFAEAHIAADLVSLATPLLVPLIEFGYSQHDITDTVIADYLQQKCFQQIEALILGCTHYPLIKTKIMQYYQNNFRAHQLVNVVDTSIVVANRVSQLLEVKGLKNLNHPVQRQFFVSDHTDFFAGMTKLFFGEKINLQYHPLWDSV